ncbi:hypothetical protein CHUAL_009294 [Chamberlinius hualienensis]
MGKVSRNPNRNRMKKIKRSVLTAMDEISTAEAKEKARVKRNLQLNDNIFAGSSLNLDKLTTRLIVPDLDDRMSIATTAKSMKYLKLNQSHKLMNKKEKRLQKKLMLARTIMALEKNKEEKKQAQRRRNTPVVGDLKLLADSLPNILEDVSPQLKAKMVNESTKSVKSFKQRRKAMLSDISKFQQVLQHPVYQKDPMNTMLQHLQNKFGD